jgi:hypothetical protein
VIREKRLRFTQRASRILSAKADENLLDSYFCSVNRALNFSQSENIFKREELLETSGGYFEV